MGRWSFVPVVSGAFQGHPVKRLVDPQISQITRILRPCRLNLLDGGDHWLTEEM